MPQLSVLLMLRKRETVRGNVTDTNKSIIKVSITVELLWNDLKGAVSTRHPKNMGEPKQVCKDKWSKIPPECCSGLIAEMLG